MAPAPTSCPDCGGAVALDRVASQYQEDLPEVRPPPIVDDLNNVIAQKAREFIVAKGMEAIQRTTDGLHEGQEQDGHVLLECIKRMATRADEFER